MLNSTKLKFWAASMIFILSISVGSPNTKNAIGNQRSDQPRSDGPVTPLSTDIQIDHVPTVGESATIACVVSSTLDAPETQVQIELPAEAELVSGSLRWQGDISEGDSVTLSATVAFNAAGDNLVSCRALRVVDESITWGDLARLYLYIVEDVSAMGFAPRPKGSARGQLLQAGAYQTTSSVNAQGLLAVTGRWGYYDRNNNFVGAKGMYVELTRGDLPYANLAWCVTDDNGFYNCGPVANPGAVGIKTWISAYSTYGPYNDLLTVLDPERGTDPSLSLYNYYQISSDAQVLPDGAQDIGTWNIINGDTWEGAFWIQRDLGDVWRYIYNSTGSTQVPQETAGPGIVEWNFTSTDGTYYLEGEHIHLAGEDSETNSLPEHEYGHNIMYNVYGLFPESFCPSPHFVDGVSHVNCAWTEGWADFVPLATNNDPVFRWPGGASINLETATWGTFGFDQGDSVEGRVAGALWDILDAVNDVDDQYSDGGLVNIWDTFYHQNNDNFGQYWSAWTSRGHNRTNAVMSIYQNTIDYRIISPQPIKGDFNGDGLDETGIFSAGNSVWFIKGKAPFVYGAVGDIPVVGDYNGDGKDDIAVFRPTNSTWYLYGIGPFVYGTVGDIPVVADYNGDGKADIAVFRPTNSTWYLYGIGPFVYGTVGDIPVIGDYNGDGKADIAVFRPTNSTWYIYGIGPFVYGAVGDLPVIGDYTGDGKADIAVFRPTNSTWYIYGVGPSLYGAVGDVPVIGDYTGDGKADITVFRPGNNTFYIFGVGPVPY